MSFFGMSGGPYLEPNKSRRRKRQRIRKIKRLIKVLSEESAKKNSVHDPDFDSNVCRALEEVKENWANVDD